MSKLEIIENLNVTKLALMAMYNSTANRVGVMDEIKQINKQIEMVINNKEELPTPPVEAKLGGEDE